MTLLPGVEGLIKVGKTINENSPVGTVVDDLSTRTDAGTVFTGVSSEKFSISPSGLITVATKNLDREEQASVKFTVEAGGDTYQYTVSLRDENDNAPKVSPASYATSFDENAAEQKITQVFATDPDSVVTTVDQETGAMTVILGNGFVSYRLVGGDAKGQFRVDEISGDVFTTAVGFDHEDIDAYELIVEAYDQGVPAQATRASVFVTVVDLNDNAPLFSLPTYVQAVSEAAAVGAVVLRVEASDRDSGDNARFEFSVSGGTGVGTFDIDPTSGEVRLLRELDHETTTEYTLDLTVTDFGPTRLSSTATVTIHVTDTNDNAPVFPTARYNRSISEYTAVSGTPVETVRATDEDSGDNQIITYSLSPADGPFAIDEVSGDITVISGLDYETQTEWVLAVTAANDLGQPFLQTVVQVVLHVVDENDNAPVFTTPVPDANNTYTHFLAENHALGEIGRFTATDQDASANAELRFDASGQQGPFRVAPDGTLSLASELDREAQDEYTFQVTVSDAGTPSLSASMTVVVRVTDFNDNAPVPARALFEFTISEGLSPTGELGIIEATDADAAENRELSFSTSTAYDIPFEVDPGTGRVTLREGLDRETRDRYDFRVVIADGGTPSLSVQVDVVVTVTDENDNAPVFVEESVGGVVRELAGDGTVIATVRATDTDMGVNSEVVYAIVAGDESRVFAVDASTGEISKAGFLDRETTAEYTLTVAARDRGGGAGFNSAFAVVTVSLVDDNDNTPVFDQSGYTASVSEAAASDSVVVTVSAVDRDVGQNAELAYYIVGGNSEGHFQMVASTGQLVVREALDRELRSSYRLTVVAEDFGNPRQTASVLVDVEVTDVNDNDPQLAASPTAVFVTEGPAHDLLLQTFVASDADAGDNAAVRFAITAGNGAGKFSIDEMSGEVRVVGELDRETTPEYTLTVEARDLGQPPRRDTAMLTVAVQDVNDNVPVLVGGTTTVSVAEDTLADTILVDDFQVSDPDDGDNGRVTMTVLRDTELFEMRGYTLYLKGELDYETAQAHTVQIEVADSGAERRNNFTVLLTVTVEDVNDNAPVFVESTYQGFIVENSEAVSFTGVTVLATDDDSGVHAETVYTIVDNHTFFSVRPDGEVWTKSSFNFEANRLFVFEVQADDGVFSSRATVTIVVEDVNEPHTFTARKLTLPPIPENSSVEVFTACESPHTTILPLEVKEEDVGDAGTISFSIRSVVPSPHPFVLCGNRLVLAASLDREETARYTLIVTSSDASVKPFEDEVTITVVVADSNDEAPTFAEESYKQIVSEAAIIPTAILTVEAVDQDEAVHSQITYSLDDGDSNHLFAINSSSGEITLAQTLDRERAAQHILTVRASDNGGLFSLATVSVVVQDENDNRPKFAANSLHVDYPEESADVFVAKLTATDDDVGDNASPRYSLVASSVQGLVQVDAETGRVFMTGRVDREAIGPVVTASFVAADGGTPVLASDPLTLTISIVDINDHTPLFERPDYAVTLREPMNAGSVLTTVIASDLDDGAFGVVSYSLIGSSFANIDPQTGTITLAVENYDTAWEETPIVQATDGAGRASSVPVHLKYPKIALTVRQQITLLREDVSNLQIATVSATGHDLDLGGVILWRITSGDPRGFFSISPEGVLAVRHMVDYEETTEYNITVLAVHSEQNNNQATVVVSLQVANVNDNVPQQVEQYSNLYVSEDTPAGTPIVTVKAVDKDGDVLAYSIVFGDYSRGFTIDADTGEITTVAASWDRETLPTHALVVKAEDGKHSAYFEVIISVKDINDSPPVIVDSSGSRATNLSVTLWGNHLVGSTVFQVEATDLDEGVNAELSFAVAAESSHFSVDASSGLITLREEFDMLLKPRHTLSVVVSDAGVPALLSEPVTLTVHLKAHFVRTVFSVCSSEPVAHLKSGEGLAAALVVALAVREGDVSVITGLEYTDCLAVQLQVLAFSAMGAQSLINGGLEAALFNNTLRTEVFGDAEVSLSLVFPPVNLGVYTNQPSGNVAPVVVSKYTSAGYVSAYDRDPAGTLVEDVLKGAGFDLAGNTNHMAVVSNEDPNGEWQYRLDVDSAWQAVPRQLNEEAAFIVLARSAIRFVPASVFFHGTARLSYKIWQSEPQLDYVDVRLSQWMFYSRFSEDTVTLLALKEPELALPTLAWDEKLLHQQGEDVSPDGLQISEVFAVSVQLQGRIAADEALAENGVADAFGSDSVALYRAKVREFNAIQAARETHAQAGDSPGVLLHRPDPDAAGVWEYALGATKGAAVPPSRWQALQANTLLSATSWVRYLPPKNRHGSATVRFSVWDGIQGESGAKFVSPEDGFGAFGATPMNFTVEVAPVNDRPAVRQGQALKSLPIIPHGYEEAAEFAVGLVVEQAEADFDFPDFADRLSLLLHSSVDFVASSGVGASTQVIVGLSDFVSGDAYRYEDIEALFESITGTFAFSTRLRYNISSRFQPVSYVGHGHCGSAQTSNGGANVSSLLENRVEDVDSDELGLAVVGLGGLVHGDWQYRTAQGAAWKTMNQGLSKSKALLLAGPDRVRFSPSPSAFWETGDVKLYVQIWDRSDGNIAGQFSATTSTAFSEVVVTVDVGRNGCDGTENSGLVFDACCQCGLGGGDCRQGCDGEGGVEDACGECNGDGTSCLGCDAVPHSGLVLDECGVCNGNNRDRDCSGTCFGTAVVNECGICVLGTTGNPLHSGKDCSGDCGGSAIVDNCGECTGGGTGLAFDRLLDCSGECGGSFYVDECGICQNPANPPPKPTLDCKGVCGGRAVLDSCGDCVDGTLSGEFDARKDRCGVCDGNGTSCPECIYDVCGECNGDGTTCVDLVSVSPPSSPRTGGAQISIEGAGLFSHDEAACYFDIRVDNDDIVLQSPLVVESPTRGYCISPESPHSGVFRVSLTLDAKTSFGSASFRFYDPHAFGILAMAPSHGDLATETRIIFTVPELPPMPAIACILVSRDNLVIHATQPSATTVACTVPGAPFSQQSDVIVSPTGFAADPLPGAFSFTWLAPSPTPTSARFSASLTSLSIAWDALVRVAVENVSCDDLFFAKTIRILGTDAVCHFDAGFDLLRITLPTTATVYPGTKLYFRDRVAFALGEAHSHAFSGSVAVGDLPADAIPVAVITGSNRPSGCEPLLLSGVSSHGAGYGLLRYKWSVDVDGDHSRDLGLPLTAFLSTLDTRSSSVTVPRGLLEDGLLYRFRLRVTNVFGLQSASSTLEVRLAESILAPAVSIPGPDLLHIDAVETVTVPANVAFSGCRGGKQRLVYTWTLLECSGVTARACDTTVPLAAGVKLVRASGPSAEVRAITPVHDRYFLLSLEARLHSTPTAKASASVVVTGVAPAVTCSIDGGSRSHGLRDDLVLSGTLATSGIGGSGLEALAAAWSCKTAAGTACPRFVPSTTLGMTFPKNRLIAGSYRFTLRVTQPGTSAEAECAVDIHVVNNTLATARLHTGVVGRVAVAGRPSLGEIVSVEAVVEGAEAGAASAGNWSCGAGSSKRGCLPHLPQAAVLARQEDGRLVATLEIDTHQLQAMVTYDVLFSYSEVAGGKLHTTAASTSLSTSSQPSGGDVVVNLEWVEGSANPSLVVEAMRWSTDSLDLGLQYNFGVLVQGSDQVFPLRDFTTDPRVKIAVPHADFAATVVTTVRNRAGATTSVETPLPQSDTMPTAGSQEALSHLLNATRSLVGLDGDSQTAVAVLNAAQAIVNDTDRSIATEALLLLRQASEDQAANPEPGESLRFWLTSAVLHLAAEGPATTSDLTIAADIVTAARARLSAAGSTADRFETSPWLSLLAALATDNSLLDRTVAELLVVWKFEGFSRFVSDSLSIRLFRDEDGGRRRRSTRRTLSVAASVAGARGYLVGDAIPTGHSVGLSSVSSGGGATAFIRGAVYDVTSASLVATVANPSGELDGTLPWILEIVIPISASRTDAICLRRVEQRWVEVAASAIPERVTLSGRDYTMLRCTMASPAASGQFSVGVPRELPTESTTTSSLSTSQTTEPASVTSTSPSTTRPATPTPAANTTTASVPVSGGSEDGVELVIEAQAESQVWVAAPVASVCAVLLLVALFTFYKRSHQRVRITPAHKMKGGHRPYNVEVLDVQGASFQAGSLEVGPSSTLSAVREAISESEQFASLGMFYFVTPELDVIEGEQEGFFQVQHVFPDSIVLREVPGNSWGQQGIDWARKNQLTGEGLYNTDPYSLPMPAAVPSLHSPHQSVFQAKAALPSLPGAAASGMRTTQLQPLPGKLGAASLPPLKQLGGRRTSLSKVQLSSSSESETESEGDELPLPPPRASFQARGEASL